MDSGDAGVLSTLCGLEPHLGVEGRNWVVPLTVLEALLFWCIHGTGCKKGAARLEMFCTTVPQTHDKWIERSGNSHLTDLATFRCFHINLSKTKSKARNQDCRLTVEEVPGTTLGWLGYLGSNSAFETRRTVPRRVTRPRLSRRSLGSCLWPCSVGGRHTVKPRVVGPG